jgi:hypothetical protein
MNKQKLSWSELLRLKEQDEKRSNPNPPQKVFFEDFTAEELEALEQFEEKYLEEITEQQKYYYYEQI